MRSQRSRNVPLGKLLFVVACGLVLVAAGCGSGKSSRGRGEPTRDPNWLTVSTDAKAIEECQKEAAIQQQRELAAMQSALDAKNSYILWELKSLAESRADTLRPVLEQRLAGPETDGRFIAAVGLCLLQQPAARTAVVEALNSGNVAQQRVVLKTLQQVSISYDYATKRDKAVREFLLADPEFSKAVVALIESPDTEVAREALQLAASQQLPGAQPALVRLFTRSQGPERDRITYWLARGELQPEWLEPAIATALEPPAGPQRQRDTALVEAFARRGTPAEKQRAKECLRTVFASPPSSDKRLGMTGSQIGLLHALADTCEPDDIPWLKATLAKAEEQYVERLTDAFVRVGGTEGRDHLLKLLADPKRVPIAVDICARHFAGKQDAQLIQALAQCGKFDLRPGEQANVVRALHALGGPEADKAKSELLGRIDPKYRARLDWELSDQTLDSLREEIVKAGLLSAEEFDAALADLTASAESANPHRTKPGLDMLFAAARRGHWFDTETGEVPCRHDQLIGELAAITRQRFAPKAVSETYLEPLPKADAGEYVVRFVFEGKAFRGQLLDLGDWYDVTGVVSMLNLALEKSGFKERYVALGEGGQDMLLVFANPAALAAVARKTGDVVTEDFDQARNAGQAFEDKVIEQLEREGIED